MFQRRRLTIQGAVQGVGFRPFVYRLAADLDIHGWVVNSAQGVVVETEADAQVLDTFISRLQAELPPHATISRLDMQVIPPEGDSDFHIHHSDSSGAKSAFILPDLAICPDCLREISDPANRRYCYPFTNCTHCGPRFSIIIALPYDRPNTTMRNFVMCDQCRAEYENPLDRRFHAQPNACPRCGPQLALLDRVGSLLAERDDALQMAVERLQLGGIVAVKGLGGFHLMVDARNPEAVARLRVRKGRYAKPLAVMFPSLESVQMACDLDDTERGLLTSAQAPIVLLRNLGHEIAPQVAPDNPYLGVMLPYTPLHHLLLNDLGFPVVATSGNLSGEPICTDDHSALTKLGDIADLFLTHNRPIARHADDSVVSVAMGEPLTLRRARGYAPLPVSLTLPSSTASSLPNNTLTATGAHQKNTVALFQNEHVFLSQHLGDMDSAAAYQVFRNTLTDFQTIYDVSPASVVCDLHPDYITTRYAEESGLPVLHVQHHAAHVLSCMAEQHLEVPVLGVAWDGTGYGTDGTIWGGEFLLVEQHGIKRVAHLQSFPLPGGDLAAREPRRSLLGLLYTLYGENLPLERLHFTTNELRPLLTALDRNLNCPRTSSIGRLFDAVAALIGLGQKSSFEGQAAMALEYDALRAKTDECYPIEITPITNTVHMGSGIIEVNSMIAAMLTETNVELISAKFHNTLAKIIVEVAQQVGTPQVALTGGCFQNRVLLERTVSGLRAAGFTPYWQRHIPPNDGGIALGQIAAAVWGYNHVFSGSG